jgi:hypothetical protein
LGRRYPAGDSRFGLSLLQAGREPADEGWNQLVKQIEEAKPTVVFIGYGMASSFAGESGLGQFKADYGKLLNVIRRISPEARVVLLPPIPHENLGAPWPNPEVHNAQLALYGRAVAEVAANNGAQFIPLFDQLRNHRGAPLTSNGIHLTNEGYRVAAEVLEDQLYGSPGPCGGTRTLRASVARSCRRTSGSSTAPGPRTWLTFSASVKKSRGATPTEVLQFETLIANEEKRIAQLRALGAGHGARDSPARRQRRREIHPATPSAIRGCGRPRSHALGRKSPPQQADPDELRRPWTPLGGQFRSSIRRSSPARRATDKIIVLEDTTGAGQRRQSHGVRRGLLIPTGVDARQRRRATSRKAPSCSFSRTPMATDARMCAAPCYSGFGTEDTHHNLHTLHWGPDGRLYMNQSVYTRTDAETPHGVVRLKAGGIFRFDPRNQAMSILYRGWVNAWGHQFDAYGQSFVTDGAGFQGVSWAVDGAT